MNGFFVTAAGTDLGKTFVSCVLLRQLRAAGRSAHAFKPVVSGFRDDEHSDPARLLAAMGVPRTPEAICAMAPWRYAEPLSPDMAAARVGRPIDFAELLAFCRRTEPSGLRLIEGVGGVMAPLTATATVRDLMTALGMPAILVVGSYLGALSHALTAVAAIAATGVPLAGIIVSQSLEEPVPTDESAAAIARFVPQVPVCVMPRRERAPTAREPDLLALLAPFLERC